MESCLHEIKDEASTVIITQPSTTTKPEKASQASTSSPKTIKVKAYPVSVGNKGPANSPLRINSSAERFAKHVKDYFHYSWYNKLEDPFLYKMKRHKTEAYCQPETIRKTLNKYKTKLPPVKIALPKRTNKAQKASSKEIQMWTYDSMTTTVLRKDAINQTERPKTPKIKIIKDKGTNVHFGVKRVSRSTETNNDQATSVSQEQLTKPFPNQTYPGNWGQYWYTSGQQYPAYAQRANAWANYSNFMYAMPTFSSKLKEVEVGFKKISSGLQEAASKKNSKFVGKDEMIMQPPFKPSARTPLRNYLGSKFKSSSDEFKFCRSNLTLPTYRKQMDMNVYSRSMPCCNGMDYQYRNYMNYHYVPNIIGQPIICPGPSYY